MGTCPSDPPASSLQPSTWLLYSSSRLSFRQDHNGWVILLTICQDADLITDFIVEMTGDEPDVAKDSNYMENIINATHTGPFDVRRSPGSMVDICLC